MSDQQLLLQRLTYLEKSLADLQREVLCLRNVNVKNSWEDYVKYQSIEACHPCFQKYHIWPDDVGDVSADNPNNVICFTPTTYTMFVGSSSRTPLLAIRALRTHESAETVRVLGALDTRHRVDVEVEFRSPDAESYFHGLLKDGSSKVGQQTYETFVHVHNPSEFVGFVTERYRKTLSSWDA